MKKVNLILLSLILICVTILSGCTKQKSADVVRKSDNTESTDISLDMVKESGVIKIGIEPASVPYAEKISDKKFKGFLVDMADAIAEKAGLEAEFIDITDANIPALLQDNQIDIVLNGYTQADEKNSQIKWLNPYISDNIIIVCHKNTDITDKEALAEMKIGVVENALSHITAQSDVTLSNAEIIPFQNGKEGMLALSKRKVDALIIEDSYFYYYQKTYGTKYTVLDEIIYTLNYSMGVKKDNVMFYEEIQKIMTELKSEGTLEEISNKWFGKNLTK